MAACSPISNMALDEIRMSSTDLLDKEELDAGGFGMVSLCVHRRHGLVVLKTVYTGPQRTEYNDALLEEGKIMHRLNHNRVLKLLGLILEDGNYSLVMEYMKKGNLMNVLKTIKIPFSMKARFIMEIIEGMTYLNEQGVVHKDLKPENILVDDNFHIKIADLGVASFKAWSKLTKEETNRQRKLKNVTGPKTNAGTLFYMAPEHLNSVNAKPTEKSDVYSFGIVLWAIMADREPYENALNQEQVCFCIVKGDRPDIEETWPVEVVELMQQCWDQHPEKRPTFAECDQQFRPKYCLLEKDVKHDEGTLKKQYPGPKDFVRRMESLQLDCDAEPPTSSQTADPPHSLHSSQCLLTDNPVDESQFAAWTSNEPVESEDTSALERKLQDELSYHQRGSRLDLLDSQPQYFGSAFTEERSRRVFQEPLQSNPVSQKMPQPYQRSHVNNYQNPNPTPFFYTAHFAEGPFIQPLFNKLTMPVSWYAPNEAHRLNNGPGGHLLANPQMHSLPSFTTQPFCESNNQRAPVPESGFPEQFSSKPDYLFSTSTTVPEMGARDADHFAKGDFRCTIDPTLNNPSLINESTRSMALSDVTGLQIGNNNVMHISKPTSISPTADSYELYEKMGIFECSTLVGEKHLNLLRDNLARQWKTCARKLGLRNPDIDEIDHDYERDGLREKVYQMLQKWQMRVGTKGTTVGTLARALYDCQRTDLLNDLVTIVNS